MEKGSTPLLYSVNIFRKTVEEVRQNGGQRARLIFLGFWTQFINLPIIVFVIVKLFNTHPIFQGNRFKRKFQALICFPLFMNTIKTIQRLRFFFFLTEILKFLFETKLTVLGRFPILFARNNLLLIMVFKLNKIQKYFYY